MVRFMTDLRDDKPLWGLGEVLRLAWPAGISMLGGTVMRFVDGLMVSRLGPSLFSAQLVGGMTSFVFESFILGTLTVVNTFVSQNLGAGRHDRCGEYTWSGMAVALLLGLLAMPILLLPEWAYRLLDLPPDVRGPAALYFRYMLIGIFLSQPMLVLHRFFYGIHKPLIVLAVTLLSNGFNVAANYALIFGEWGFPALGLEGAALGTLASFALQLLILFPVFLSPIMHRRFATRRIRVRFGQCLDLLRVGWPAGVQFSNDLLSWSVFTTMLVGRFGKAHLAASTAAVRYMGLSFMPAVGVGIGVTSIVGRYIGQGRPHLARRRAHAGLLAAMVYMGLCGVGFFLFRHELVRVFVTARPAAADMSAAEAARIADDIVRYGGPIMICAAVFQLFDAIGIVFMGALRGAGDTRWPMVMTILLSWSVIVGGGTLTVRYLPGLESLGPWLAASAYIIVLGLVLARRFESGVWHRIDLLGRRPDAAPTPTAAPADDGDPSTR
jgi:MATE family multidrug resistance protein